jgi:hypothetical protein
MVFRLAYLFAIFVTLLDLEIVLNIEKANPIEKALLIVTALIYCATRKRENDNFVLLGAIIAATTLGAIFCTFPLFTWNRFARSLLSLMAFLLFLCAWPTPKDRKFVLLVLALAPLAAIVLGCGYQVLGLRKLFEVDFLGATRLGGSVGPAFLGAIAATGASAAAFLYGDRLKTSFMALAALDVAIAALSGSRMAFVVAVGVTGFVILNQRKNFLFRTVVIVYGSAALAAFLVLFSDQILKRMNSNTMSGREMIWNEVRGYILRYPKLGIGLGHQMDILSNTTTVLTHTVASHNEYLRFAVELGFVGASVFLILFVSMLVVIGRSPRMRQPGVFAVVALAFMVFSFTDNTFSVSHCFMLVIGAMMGASVREEDPAEVPAVAAAPPSPPPRVGWAQPPRVPGP